MKLKNIILEKKPEYQKLPKGFDADAEIDKLGKDNPDAEDPLNLGGKLGTAQYGNLMPGYGNYDTIDRIEKAKRSTLSLPSRLARIKDNKVKTVVNQIVVPFNTSFDKILPKNDKNQTVLKNDIAAGVEVMIDFILKSDPKKSNFDEQLEKAKVKVLESINTIKLKGSASRAKSLKSNLISNFERLIEDLLKSKKSGKLNLEEIKLSDLISDKQKQDAEELAAKTKQIATKAGEEMANFAKDVYDTPTVKRLRAYVKKEIGKLGQKLVDKYGHEKQMKIPFPKDEMDENLRNWFKKEKWKRIDTQGNIAGDCGTMPKGKKTQRCLPQAKAQSLTKKQRAATSRKKTKSNKQFVSNTKAAK